VRGSALFLLDGTLLFFRALYGMPDVFEDQQGRSINGLRGYLTYLLNSLERYQVGYCAAAFDESLTTCWRNEIYPEYKANRPAADANIRFQLGRCRELTELIGIPVLADLEYEADDFIATLARRSRREVVIVSRDKDLQQLLSPTVTLLDPSNDRLTDMSIFRDRFGFDPDQFPDYQALTGDSVDNVPGVKGVGPKTAQRLVAEFGGLETIYSQSDHWERAGIRAGSKMAANLATEQERAFLFRRIVTLEDRVPDSLSLTETRLQRPAWQPFERRLRRLGLHSGLGNSLERSLESYCV
jgi:DNA polymerase-1